MLYLVMNKLVNFLVENLVLKLDINFDLVFIKLKGVWLVFVK